MTITVPPVAEIEAAIDLPFTEWGGNCHGVSLEIVRSGLLGVPCRVARGTCPGVSGQHSWIVIGDDCYDEDATVVDPTLWSYRDDVDGIWVGPADELPHCPHGLWAAGPGGTPVSNIFAWGRPPEAPDDPVVLTPKFELSLAAKDFVMMLGPLDETGWALLVNQAPVGGWPAGEIVAAMDDTPALSFRVPIDLLGMLTDRNPRGLYR